MPELQPVDQATATSICGGNYANGLKYFQSGAVRNTWRTPSSLYGAVQGSGSSPYEVSCGPREDGAFWARCTCPAARRQPFCKHAAALLVAWSRKPDLFTLSAEPEPAPSEKKGSARKQVDSEAKRARGPKEDRRALTAAGLDKAEALLVDLCSQGLVALTREQVELIGSLAEALEAYKLRRLARQVAAIHAAAAQLLAGKGEAEELAWARLLADTWFILGATRKAQAAEEGGDQSALEELVGKTWLEKDLKRLEGLRLLELAFETETLASGFRVETSYLLDLDSGTLYTEKQITPLRLQNAAKKRSYARPLRVRAAGLYPGFPPPRLKLIAAEEEAEPGDAWERAISRAERSATALRQRLSQATASLVAPQVAYSLFRPAGLRVDGATAYMLDAEGYALPLGGGSFARLYGLTGALSQGTLGAIFFRVRFGSTSLEAEPLGVIPAIDRRGLGDRGGLVGLRNRCGLRG